MRDVKVAGVIGFVVVQVRSGLSRARSRRWRTRGERPGERLMVLLGGLPVLVAEACGDLLPGGTGGAGIGDELVFMTVELVALGVDGVERGQCLADGRGPGGCQRDLDIEQGDRAERVGCRELSCQRAGARSVSWASSWAMRRSAKRLLERAASSRSSRVLLSWVSWRTRCLSVVFSVASRCAASGDRSCSRSRIWPRRMAMRRRWAAISAWAVLQRRLGVEGAFPPGRLLVAAVAGACALCRRLC